MKRLPLGIQNFREIITGNYIYADKTQDIFKLLQGAKYYFLSRPRRFGKSLLLDTISEAFSGDKELFNGLWIHNSDYDFQMHPVIRFDMSNISNKTPDILEESLMSSLKKRAREDGLDISESIISDFFMQLIEGLYKKYDRQVVVLIDEYDKPILDHLTDIEVAELNRQVIKGFYGILKSMDRYLRFVMITGVTKFTKTSIFSELNNLLDITLTEEFANICGIVREDLDVLFAEHIEALSSLDSLKRYDNLKSEILAWYDGYSWDGATRVLNPFSLLSFFAQKRFYSFWYASGTPTFLVNMIKSNPESYLTISNLVITERMLDSFELRQLEIEPLLFQTGYLTIKQVIYPVGIPQYLLEIPNNEVNDAFHLQIMSSLTECSEVRSNKLQMDISEAFRVCDLSKVLDMLRGLFASIPYQLHVNAEAYYHSIFYAVMSVLGFDITAEVSTSRGRIDATLDLGDKVYVIEFKYIQSPPEASEADIAALSDAALSDSMKQIEDRGYCEKYIGSGKAVYQVAFAFLGRERIEMAVNRISD